MAIVRAIASGNWSNTAIWSTGALPTAADDVYSNTFTVTIDQSATVLQISNAAATGVTAGGGFTMSAGGYTLTANANASGAVNCLTVSNGAGTTATVVGNVQGGTTGKGILFSGAGTLNVTGSSTGGTAGGGAGIDLTGTGTVNLTGAPTGGSNTTANGVRQSSVSGTLNVTGTSTGGSAGAGIFANAVGPINHTGTVQASSAAPGVDGIITAVMALTGPFLTNSTGVNPVTAARWFWLNTSPPATYYQIRSANLAVIRPLYTADSVGGNPATSNVRSGTVYGPNNELTGTAAIPGAASVLAGVPVDATTGTATISAADIRAAVGLASANLDAQFAAIPAAPSATAIRIEMDSNSTKLANLDATVSSRLASSSYSAPLDAAGTRSAVGLATGNLDTQLSGLSSGISGLPNASAIASAVWGAATRTLTTAIDNSATIAAAVWSYASGRTITGGTVDTLTNAPSVPSAATIAAAVWNSLTASYSTNGTFGKHVLIGSSSQREVAVTGSHHVAADIHELQPAVIESSHFAAGALDGVRSSIGLASANLDTQLNALPTAAENATATRSELASELARMANAATTQEVGDIVEGAM